MGLPFWSVPHPRNEFFTGRDEVVAEVRKRLTRRRKAALVEAISGLGGIGKTQTAVEYAYRYRDKYQAARPLVWALIKEMARISRESGAQFLVTLSPHDMSPGQDRSPWRVASFLEEFAADARSAGVPARQCIAEFFARGGNGRFVLSNELNYLNGQGNGFIATATRNWLTENYPLTVAKSRSE